MKELKALAIRNDSYLEYYKQNFAVNESLDTSNIEACKLFIETIDADKSVGINVDLLNLWKILQTGEYRNIFELGYSRQDIKERYNKGGPFYIKLEHFTTKFDPKLQIKYAALNIGNVGTNYKQFGNGEICIILKEDFLNRIEKMVCLKYYSLKYFSEAGLFEEENFNQDIGFWNRVDSIALAKHLPEIIIQDLNNWKDLITNGSKGWLEILIAENIQVSHFKIIRIKKKRFDFLNELILTGDSQLDEMGLLYKFQFNEILKYCSLYNIKIESI